MVLQFVDRQNMKTASYKAIREITLTDMTEYDKMEYVQIIMILKMEMDSKYFSYIVIPGFQLRWYNIQYKTYAYQFIELSLAHGKLKMNYMVSISAMKSHNAIYPVQTINMK